MFDFKNLRSIGEYTMDQRDAMGLADMYAKADEEQKRVRLPVSASARQGASPLPGFPARRALCAASARTYDAVRRAQGGQAGC